MIKFTVKDDNSNTLNALEKELVKNGFKKLESDESTDNLLVTHSCCIGFDFVAINDYHIEGIIKELKENFSNEIYSISERYIENDDVIISHSIEVIGKLHRGKA